MLERHTLLELLVLRPVLEQEDARERMPGRERGRCAVGRLRDLVREAVDLGDRLPEVPLVDSVCRSTSVATQQGVLSGPGSLLLADPVPHLRNPLEGLQIGERLGPAEDFRCAQRQQELLRIAERAHAQTARADALQDVRVRARAHRQVVLAREAQRLVVEGLEQEPRVVDLEDVDVGEMPVQRLRVGIACRRSNGCGM